MGLGQPTYVSQTSSGSSPWQKVDNERNPFSLGLQVVRTTVNSSAAGTYQIDVTLDDPTGMQPNPVLNSSVAITRGQSFAASVSVLPSSAIGGPTTGSSGSFIGAITTPIAAWRLTQSSSSDVTVVTAIQSGPR